uniref:Tetraspanin 37 n=1 Tax=Neolamprologus brichardi TaxID=32507 RepID=A0A3Q4HZX1_NEOBR
MCKYNFYNFFILIYQAVGILVWLNGVYLLIKYGEYSRFFSESYMTLTVLVTVTSAALLLVTGCVGSWVSLKDSICLQGLVRLSVLFENYTGSSEDSNSRSVDAMQEELKCCGVKNYTDWLETTWFNKSGKLRFPYSCYPSVSLIFLFIDSIFQGSCVFVLILEREYEMLCFQGPRKYLPVANFH